MALQQISANDVSFISTNGGLQIPTGTTAQRPGTPSTGLTRYNTTTGQMETYSGSSWNGLGGLIMQSVQNSNFNAVAGSIYPVNTTSNTVIVTLPSSPIAGQQINIFDYAGTSSNNNIQLSPNGNNINGSNGISTLNTSRGSVTLTYVDNTQGWIGLSYYDGLAVLPPMYSITYLLVSGGGGGGGTVGGSVTTSAGGGGGGGVVESTTTLYPGTLYTVTVGAGGSGSTGPGNGSIGNASYLGSLTVTAGSGATYPNGGSSGNGFAGGVTYTAGAYWGAGGGGGASAAGTNGASTTAGNGGAGLSKSTTGSSVTYGGGGGGGIYDQPSGYGTGGSGGGANGKGSPGNGNAGTANLGGGGGGAGGGSSPAVNYTGGQGGSGLVVLVIPTTRYSGITTGTPNVAISGANTILTFTSSGSYTG